VNAARLGLLLATCVIATGWSGAAESARKKTEPTLGALAGRSAPIDRSQAVQSAPEDAASSYEAFLRIEGADPALKAQALRRVGDLRLEQAAALSAADTESDAAAQARAREAVTAYQQLLREYPDYAARDAVLYQLARASEVAGDSDAALAALVELVARHPARRGLLQYTALCRRRKGLWRSAGHGRRQYLS
jgi:tetratricopeptide (TPR) repeat protein